MSFAKDLLRSPDVTDGTGQELPPRAKWRVSGNLTVTDTGTELVLGAGLLAAAFAQQGVVPGTESEPEFEVIGAFVLDVQPSSQVQLEAIGLVSQEGLLGAVALYDLTAAALVFESITVFDAPEDTRVASPDLSSVLEAGHLYQFMAACVGGGASIDFAVIRYAMLKGL
jgi:hypothetical protein